MKIKVEYRLPIGMPKPSDDYLKRASGNEVGRFLAENDLLDIESFELEDRRIIETEIFVFKPSEIERVIKALELAKNDARIAIEQSEMLCGSVANGVARFMFSEFQEAIDKLKEGSNY